MQTFDLRKLLAESEKANRPWLEFIRVPGLSMGIYRLKAGQADPQQPHTEDEVYHVLSGRGWFRAGQAKQEVEPGTLIFIERALEHRFFDIAEDLTVLVLFAPAEGSLKG
jgi:quercetin dioxygenase-like cupin family protein